MSHDKTAVRFLNELAHLSGGCSSDERFIMQVLPGDPGEAGPAAWRPRAWRPGDLLPASPERTNGYVGISTFGRASDGSWRRQKGLFKSIRAVMIDDVGTKVHLSRASVVTPTWRVLTSPGNEQWLYLIKGGSEKSELAEAVINGLVEQALLPKDDKDPGMKGVTRVARVPGFINGKAKYGGSFRVQWVQDCGPLHTLESLVEGFGLKVYERRSPVRDYVDITREEHIDRLRMFNLMKKAAGRYGMLLKKTANASGWIDVRCPWESEHSAGDRGAAIGEPHAANHFHGAFRCHHGHCDGRGWRDFTDYLHDLIVADIEAANRNWKNFEGEE